MKLPLRIVRSGESCRVLEAVGVALCHLYFEDEPSRRAMMKRLTSAQAEALARAIARHLTDNPPEIEAEAEP